MLRRKHSLYFKGLSIAGCAATLARARTLLQYWSNACSAEIVYRSKSHAPNDTLWKEGLTAQGSLVAVNSP